MNQISKRLQINYLKNLLSARGGSASGRKIENCLPAMLCKAWQAGKLKIPALFLSISILFQLVSPSLVLAQSSEPTDLQQMASLLSSLQSIFNALKMKVQALKGGSTVQTAQAQIADVTSGLIGHWKFDEGTGTTATDSSGNNNTGTLTNGPAWTTGKIGGALSFDGTNDYVTVPHSSPLQVSSSITISAWIMKNSFSGDDYIVIKDAAGNYMYRFFTTGPGGCCSAQNSLSYTPGGGGAIHTGGSLSTGQWYHAVVVFDDAANTVKTYVDAVQILSETDTVSSWATGAGALSIGSSKGTANFFDGRIDDVRIYNRALSAAEVQTVYNVGSGSTPPPSDTIAPTVSMTAPSSGSTVSGSSVIVSANASDNVGVVGVQFKLDGANLQAEDTSSPYSITWNTTTTSNGSHMLSATARDAAGNQTTSSGVTVTVNNASPPSDTQAPSVPTGLTATAQSSSQINLSWTASTDNVGVTGYRVERCQGSSCTNFVQISTPSTNSYNDTGLIANTTYRYQVRATDAAGNLSGYSNIASATTQSGGGGGTALGNLAASMAPGTWAQLTTTGFNNGGLLEVSCAPSNVVEYADSATWDSISRQFIFYGASHGTCYGQKLIKYSDATNTWSTGPLFPGSCSGQGGCFEHAYHQNAMNPANGDFFYRPYGSNNIHKYSTNGNQQWSTYTNQVPNGSSNCCGAIEYFPDMNGMIYVNGPFKSVHLFNNSTGQWSTLATGLAIGDYDNVIEYSPVHHIILIGGGRGASRVLYKLNASGQVTRMADAPANVLEGSVGSHSSIDPVSGHLIGFLPGGNYYEYNVFTNTWRQMTDLHPLTDAYGYFELAEASITTYGVQMFVMHNPGRIYLYKHSTGGTPPPSDTQAPSTPTGLSATTVSSSQINLSWTASTDNVGVTGYRVERCQGSTCTNFSQISTPSGTSYSDAGLTANTTYRYQVRAADAAGNLSGYSSIASAATQTTAPPPSTKFVINDRVQVSSGPLNVRSTPSTSGTLLGTQATNALGTVIGGPTVADGYNWWNINYDSGVDGWSAEDFLVKYTPGGGITITDNTWVSRTVPVFPQSIDMTAKHVRWVYDTDRGVFYAWGGDYCVPNPVSGTDRCASHEEFWEYDLTQNRWTLLLDQIGANQLGYPQGRCLPGMAYDPIRKVVWMASGQYRHDNYYSGLQSGGLWAFNPATRVWSREGPSADAGESPNINISLPDMLEYIAYDPVNNTLFAPSRTNAQYSLAGVTVRDGVQNDNWSVAPFSANSPVFGNVAFAVDSRRNRAIVYDPYLGETWSYSFTTRQTTKLSSQALPAKSVFGMDYDVVNDVVLFFGGLDEFEGQMGADYINELWKLDLSTNQWSRLNFGGDVPSPRKGETLVYDVRNNVHVIMGGTGGFETFNDRIFLLRLNLGGTPPPTDTQAPTVSVTAPTSGSIVSGASVTVSANASDNVGVTGVQFKLDGANLGSEDTTSPYSMTWNTTLTSNGSHTLTATARDAAGNQTTSSSVTVTVSNGSGGSSITVNPSSSWCSTINSAVPGTEIIFTPGNYSTTCNITISGTASAPIVIRSESETNRATFNYPGSAQNILEVRGSYLTLRGFAFRPSSDAVDAIRILGGVRNIIVERNDFRGTANIMISANSGNTQELVIRDNTLVSLLNTPIYIGTHDGSSGSTNLLFERNFIDGVNPPDPSTGYGIEVKLNSWATIRDNTIYRTKGPPIMTYGSNNGSPASIIEGNYTEGSINEGGIVISGGPAIVRNNVAVNNGFGGISVQNYNGRNLIQNIQIVHNTLINNFDSGINLQSWNSSTNVLAYNAILPRSGTSAIRPAPTAGTNVGNITCTTSCFVNAITAPYDLWPTTTSQLLNAAGSGSESWRPLDDFMGEVRGTQADVGAFERTSSTANHLVGNNAARPPRVSGTPPSTLVGDLNADRTVNALDWSIMNSQWNTNNSQSDINSDGIVNSIDFSLMNANWGRTI